LKKRKVEQDKISYCGNINPMDGKMIMFQSGLGLNPPMIRVIIFYDYSNNFDISSR